MLALLELKSFQSMENLKENTGKIMKNPCRIDCHTKCTEKFTSRVKNSHDMETSRKRRCQFFVCDSKIFQSLKKF